MYVKVNYNNVNSLLPINILLQKKPLSVYSRSHIANAYATKYDNQNLIFRTHKINYHNIYYENASIMSDKHTYACTHMHTKTHIHTKEMNFFKHSPGILRFHTIQTILSNLVLGSVLRTLFQSVFLLIENLVPSFRVISCNSASAKVLWALQLFI